MPDYMNNPTGLHMELNKICTYLWEGEAWHEKMAGENRKISIRGVARWHEAEAKCDMKERLCLEKILRDKLMFSPDIDMSFVDRAIKMTMANAADFKAHFSKWIEREETLVDCINKAITMASSADMELYRELCCLVDEVQNEIMRARMVYDRLELAGWNGHDIGVCSKWLHDYFECHYDGGMIDFNLG